ncbi:unnamed protein product [Cuscuta epithymum]|uniref:DNA topoisomerase I n=1 Tax=Cuscuta epithymum TaxID=186058 RepID=A0AAV0DUD5_9ASTE|nr:unnamed protein product [Cuscuta epithymum]
MNSSESKKDKQRELSSSSTLPCKRCPSEVESSGQGFAKKAKLDDSSAAVNSKQTSVKEEEEEEEDDDDDGDEEEEEEEEEDDEEDDIPISNRITKKSSVKAEEEEDEDDEEDDIPISNRITKKSSVKVEEEEDEDDEEDDIPISNRIKKKSSVKAEEEEDEDDIPISHRARKTPSVPVISKSSSRKKPNGAAVASSSGKTRKNNKSKESLKKDTQSSKVLQSSGGAQKWTTLVHNGVIFPPPYKPHGVKMLYKGKPVNLTAEQEEVATMYAVMLDTDYMNNPKFKENFMNDWRIILGRNHVIQSLEDCDFRPIYEWYQKEKEKKKQMSTEEKKAIKEEKMKAEEKYMWAIVDGVKEKVGNFRVEPPGLFRGRGEHPKMGKLKRRIHPSDITLNIGKDAPIPECPIPGERWKEIRHDNTVTWLAYWSDPINPKEFKYVFLAASSSLKGQSDKEKYEKARLLKEHIDGIRAAYSKDFTSEDPLKRQIAVATYLIDKLALRAGNEKDDEEAADTVGCCTLKVGNVEPVPPNTLKFDFLGKDSIRYQRDVQVEKAAFKAIKKFRSGKREDDDLFELLDTNKLNAHLKSLMPGLTAKVFRTYNASITLQRELDRLTNGRTPGDHAVEKYLIANKQVAILCNHQRSAPKTHDEQISRLRNKIEELKAVLDELRSDLVRVEKGKPQVGKTTKRNLAPEALKKKIDQTNVKIVRIEKQIETKEDMKNVALGTSKTNYLDPRISVAWCKRNEVPIEKIFTKTHLQKFAWAMDVHPDFSF